jgi:hypothetical protein
MRNERLRNDIGTRGDPPMKHEALYRTTEDRLATLEEVRCATISSRDNLLDLCQVQGNYCQMDSDTGGIIRYPNEEFEFFAYLSEMDGGVPN